MEVVECKVCNKPMETTDEFDPVGHMVVHYRKALWDLRKAMRQSADIGVQVALMNFEFKYKEWLE